MRMNVMGGLQRLGRSLMLPIAVLPIAGLLLRLGQPDLLDIDFIAAAGQAIFENLALIFAVGLAIGFADDSNGAAGLAGVVGYLVLSAVLKALNPDINMGVLAGIIAGIVAGLWYNRCKDIKLPDYLAFFGGRRFVPIITGLTAVALGWLFGWLWPPIQEGIDQLGKWLIDSGELGLFVYGLLNRLLIVTGLHHVLNSFVWFIFGSFDGATGDLNRFFAGDPAAGSFMAGFFPVMMFGLPAAALAMYHAAPRERRHQVGGMLLSLALTAFLTGITEPIEFTFMFLAPVLYALHAVLTGISMAVMGWLGVKLGFTFSAGAFDYVLSYGLSTRGWLLLPVGVAYAIVYYGVFRWTIVRFNLLTPGREPLQAEDGQDDAARADRDGDERGLSFVRALGGADNLSAVGACTTRLRLVVNDMAAIDELALKRLGSRGVMRLKNGHLQVILGPIADGVADEIRAAVADAGNPLRLPAQNNDSACAKAERQAEGLSAELLAAWRTALGGSDNIREVSAVAATRLRVRLASTDTLDSTGLETLGGVALQRVGNDLIHIVIGAKAEQIAAGLQQDKSLS
ncbi:N-acetylglucosamine-specific PTS transporter subunit IIBC [Phytohalomonas tamaricis]|uniref:N-acetylglucosamine-specific PTS transporter subunit IIBC n=1 Tax=Phytohalomonas tamaricis TaxID=2081032 RepID=UPI000D0BB9A2|nr:N-acetylglucosamine-specific PTS transporter subunit IIBC [Phytohalomonas tamaricis]